MVLIPLTGMFITVSYLVYEKQQKVQDVLKVDDYFSVSKNIIILADALQKERYHSLKYILSNTKQQSLSNPRIQTDTILKKSIPLLEKSASKSFNLSTLKKTRALIDDSKTDDKTLELTEKNYNTIINFLYDDIISALSTISQNKNISQTNRVLLLILKIKEKSSIEHFLLEKMFYNNKVTASDFKKFGFLLNDQNSNLKYLKEIVSKEQKSSLEKIEKSRSYQEVNQIREIIFSKVQKNALLSKIKEEIGFGGLVHLFKNYLLRSKPTYLELFNEKYELFLEYLEEYSQNDFITEDEEELLDIIESTFSQYKIAIDTLQNSINMFDSIQQADEYVRIDDTEAIKAIQKLSTTIQGIEAEKWSEISKNKIDEIQRFEKSLLQNMHTIINEEHQAHKNLFWFFLILSALTLLTTIAITIATTKNIIKDIMNFQQGILSFFSYLNKEKEDIEYLNTDASDEIADMSLVVNQNIKNTKKAIVQDNLLIDDMTYVAEKISLGHFNQRVEANANNEELNILKDLVNTMVEAISQNIDKSLVVLQSYEKQDYKQKLLLDCSIDGHMKKIFLGVNSLGDNLNTISIENQHYIQSINELNDNLEKKVKQRTRILNLKSKKVTDLLNNTGEGFLSFGLNFYVENEYSIECENIFGTPLNDKNILDLLWGENIKKKEFFASILKDAAETEDKVLRKSYLSLLDKEITINNKTIKVDYKLLDNQFYSLPEEKHYMLILVNITEQKLLEEKIKKEQQLLKMVVSVVSDTMQFYDICDDFEVFCSTNKTLVHLGNTPLNNLNILYRQIHTFKGLFSQLFMTNTVEKLHSFEEIISDFIKKPTTNEDILELLSQHNLQQYIKQDMELLKEILGESFVNQKSIIKIDKSSITTLENKITNYCKLDKEHADYYEDILLEIEKIKSISVKKALSSYPKLSMQFARKLHKEIYKFEILGENIIRPNNFKPFFKSLVHVFRNCIDHGIETPETRESLNKDPIGTIHCSFKIEEKKLLITISDDGAGIDTEVITQKYIDEGLGTKEEIEKMTNTERTNLIFHDAFSIKDTSTELSGRGIGMASVKDELEKIAGNYEISTEINKGTTFTFILPFRRRELRIRTNELAKGNI